MSFGFAVSDLIAVGKLISDIIASLRDVSGAVHQFQQLSLTLHNLGHALAEVDKIEGPADLQHMVNAIKATALSCRLPLSEFLTRNQKYYDSLSLMRSSGKIKDVGRRIRWGLVKQSEVNELRAILNGHVASINMLLALYAIKCSAALARVDCITIPKSVKDKEDVDSIETTPEEYERNTALAKRNPQEQQRWSLSSLLPGITTLSETVTKIYKLNISIFNLLQDRLSNVPSPDLGHTWAQSPVFFEDALGRRHYIPSEYTWEMLEGVILGAFARSPGKSFVRRGAYELFNTNKPEKVISRSQSTGFLPGEKITMAMILEQDQRYARMHQQSRRCRIMAQGEKVSNNCAAWYQFTADRQILRTQHTVISLQAKANGDFCGRCNGNTQLFCSRLQGKRTAEELADVQYFRHMTLLLDEYRPQARNDFLVPCSGILFSNLLNEVWALLRQNSEHFKITWSKKGAYQRAHVQFDEA